MERTRKRLALYARFSLRVALWRMFLRFVQYDGVAESKRVQLYVRGCWVAGCSSSGVGVSRDEA